MQQYVRVQRHELQQTLDDLAAEGKRVTSLASDDSGVDLIVEPAKTRASQAKETR